MSDGVHALRTWLSRHADTGAEVFTPEEALLGGRFARYAARRLLAFGLVRSLGLFLHLIELALLSEVFYAKAFVASLAMQNGLLVADAFAWGALEGLRRRARALGPGVEAAACVTRWLGLAMRLALVVLLAPLALAVYRFRANGQTPSMLDVYAFVCAARLAADLVLRTYFSGVFAHRRVHRTAWSIVVGPVLLVAVTLALWRPLAGWAFPIALLAAALLSRGLLFVFTRRAYRRHRIVQPSWRRALRSPGLGAYPKGEVRDALVAGVGNLTTRIGSVALLAMVVPTLAVVSEEDGGGLDPYAYALHLAGPTLFAASQWASVFYHDHKRIEGDAARAIDRQLARALVVTALVVAVVAWAFTAGTILLLVPRAEAEGALAALLVASIGLALWTGAQTRALARGAFGVQLVSGLVALLVLVVTVVSRRHDAVGPAPTPPLAALASAPWAALVAWMIAERFRRDRIVGLQPSVGVWTRGLAQAPSDTVVWQATVRAHPVRVAERIARQLGDRGAIVRAGAHLLWYERVAPTPRATWLRLGGGCLDELRQTTAAAGVVALGLEPPSPAGLADLRAHHAEAFPGSFVLDIGRPAPRAFVQLDAATRQAIWADAVRSARAPRIAADWHVTAYAPHGVVEAIFVAPRPIDPARATDWRNRSSPHRWRRVPAGATRK